MRTASRRVLLPFMADSGGPSGAVSAGFMPWRWHLAWGWGQPACQDLGSESVGWAAGGAGALCPHLGSHGCQAATGLGTL